MTHRRLCLLNVLNAMPDEFIESLELVDGSKLAATCRALRGIQFSLIVKEGSLDFSRLIRRRRVSDVLVQSVLGHVENLRSIESAMPRSEIIGIDFPPYTGCYDLTDEAFKAIAANCHSLTSLNAFHCHQLKDEAFKTIAANCPGR